MLRIITGPAADSDIHAIGMSKISMTAFSTAILESGFGQLTHQFPDLRWHAFIVPLWYHQWNRPVFSVSEGAMNVALRSDNCRPALEG